MEDDTGDGGVFPLALEEGPETPLELDISPLPSGLLRFDSEPFARRVIEARGHGIGRVTLDVQNAGAWGFRYADPLPAGAG